MRWTLSGIKRGKVIGEGFRRCTGNKTLKMETGRWISVSCLLARKKERRMIHELMITCSLASLATISWDGSPCCPYCLDYLGYLDCL